MTETRPGPRTFWLIASLFGFLTILFMLVVTLRPGSPGLSRAADDLGELLAALTAGAACVAAGRRLEDSRAGWGFLAASSFTWAAGEAAWCYESLVRSTVPRFPSPADAGFLLAVPLAVIGLRLFPGPARSASAELGGQLDRMLVGLAGFLVAWVIVARAVFGVPVSTILRHVVGLAYPVSDVVMLAVVALAALRERRHRTSLSLVLAGILAFTVADSSSSLLTAAGRYGAVNPLNTGWVLGHLLVALGGLWALTSAGSARDGARVRWTIPEPEVYPMAAGAGGVGLKERAIVPEAYLKHSWMTKSAANQIVYTGCALLALADAGITLYDLVQFLKMAN